MHTYLIKKSILFLIVGAALFSGSAIAAQIYASDNTPEKGYLLCANIKTKAVTFPGKLNCPTGTKALDLGAVLGSAETQSAGYLVNLKPQDVSASVTSKTEKVIISKSNFNRGYYSLLGEIAVQFLSTNSQVVLCNSKITGNSRVTSGFPSHELANTWTAHTAVVAGIVRIDSQSDILSINCSFTGNAKVLYGYMSLVPIESPQELISD